MVSFSPSLLEIDTAVLVGEIGGGSEFPLEHPRREKTIEGTQGNQEEPVLVGTEVVTATPGSLCLSLLWAHMGGCVGRTWTTTPTGLVGP